MTESNSHQAAGNTNRLEPVACAVCILLFALCSSVQSQPLAPVAKIGWLFGGSAGSMVHQRDEILRLLRELGYIENKNVAFQYRYANNNLDRLPVLADELVGLKVNLVLVRAPRAALAAKNATKTIPIVFYDVADPVALGLVDSLVRPGGNLTGLTIITETLVGKRLELLKETVPKLFRVAVLWNPLSPGNALQWKESQLQAQALGLQLHSMEVSSAAGYETAFEVAVKAHIAAVAVTPDPLVTDNFKRIASLLTKYHLPALADRGEFVEIGGLMSYGADQSDQARRVVAFVDKILKGANPADLPVEQPTKFDLTINLKTAQQIGLSIPPNVLARADRVIK